MKRDEAIHDNGFLRRATRARGFLCSPPLYEYEHAGRVWLFEYGHLGPWPVRDGGEPFKRAGDKFYAAFYAWRDEPDPEQYRVGGGCEEVGV